MESAISGSETKNHKLQYVLWTIGALGLYVLSLLEPSIHGPMRWAIFCCMAAATSISALKLRYLIHGTGWVFPRTNTLLMWIVPIEALLYLWFSH